MYNRPPKCLVSLVVDGGVVDTLGLVDTIEAGREVADLDTFKRIFPMDTTWSAVVTRADDGEIVKMERIAYEYGEEVLRYVMEMVEIDDAPPVPDFASILREKLAELGG